MNTCPKSITAFVSVLPAWKHPKTMRESTGKSKWKIVSHRFAVGDEKPAQAVLAWLLFDFCLWSLMLYSSFYAWLNVREIWGRVIQQFPKLTLRCLLLSPTYLFCFGSTKWRSVPFNTLTAEGHGRTNPFASVANTLSSARQQTIGAPIRLSLSCNQRLQK